MQVCLVYFDGLEEPQAMREYLRSQDSFEVSMQTWLVAHPQTATHLYFDIQKCISRSHGLVVVPLEPRLVPIYGQNNTPLYAWLEEQQKALTT